MQLIKPSLISGEIMTLIEEADEKVVLICPYVKIKKWYKLLNKLKVLKQRNIDVEIYVREHENESIEEILAIGYQPILVPNLHAKVYLNEKYAIVSSMNLLLSSDTNSIDIGFKTENEKEYNEVKDYYIRYIRNPVVNPKSGINADYDWREELENGLYNALNRTVRITEFPGKLQINTANRYEVAISHRKGNCLEISGILSNKEYEYALANPFPVVKSKIQFELAAGRNGYYDMAWGKINELKSSTINNPDKAEEQDLVNSIIDFISGVEFLKNAIR